MIYVTRRAVFSASHRLYNPKLTDEQNDAVYDKCGNNYGHGHNYVLEVTVAGEVNPRTGYLIDLKKLKMIIQNEILDLVDHKYLNLDVPVFAQIVPTAENIAKVIWTILEPKITEGRLYSIRLHETENNTVEYRGEGS